MVIAGIDPDPARAADLRAWGREYWRAVHPFNQAGGYVNFMMDDEGPERTQMSYGRNYARLLQVKEAYDPENLFRINHNITRRSVREGT